MPWSITARQAPRTGHVKVEYTLALNQRFGADGVVASRKQYKLDLGAELGERLGRSDARRRRR